MTDLSRRAGVVPSRIRFPLYRVLVVAFSGAVLFLSVSVTRAESPALVDLQKWVSEPAANRAADAPVLHRPLSRGEATQAVALLASDRFAVLSTERAAELDQQTITNGDKILHWESRVFGDAPPLGHSLWISMHGGGNAPHSVNDSQWKNQIKLYEPAEGIYVAPRAPTDNWNLWHENHIDPMFQRLIEDYVVLKKVNPNRIYLMG